MLSQHIWHIYSGDYEDFWLNFMSSNTKENRNIFNVGNLSALFYKVPDGGFKVVFCRVSMLIKNDAMT